MSHHDGGRLALLHLRMKGGEAMGTLEIIGLISLVLMALEVGFHFGQKK